MFNVSHGKLTCIGYNIIEPLALPLINKTAIKHWLGLLLDTTIVP